MLANKVYKLQNVEIANTPYKRMKGLLGRSELEERYALVIVPCNSIHTFFMQLTIDALFVDKNKYVLAIYEDIERGRMIAPIKHCHYVIEMKAQHIGLKVKVGERIEW